MIVRSPCSVTGDPDRKDPMTRPSLPHPVVARVLPTGRGGEPDVAGPRPTRGAGV